MCICPRSLSAGTSVNCLDFSAIVIATVCSIIQDPNHGDIASESRTAYSCSFALSSCVTLLNASACGECGLPTTVGLPASASEQIWGCSGMSPSKLIPSSLHFFLAPASNQCSCLLLYGVILTIKPKDVMIVSAVGTSERAHVLHHAQNWHFDFLEELYASHCIP